MKSCSKCKETKPLHDFHRHYKKDDGHVSICKACMNARQKAYYHQQPDERLKRSRHRKEVFMAVKSRPYFVYRLNTIRQRCENPKHVGYPRYGGCGIKNFLTVENLIFLWNRDRADLMEKPHVDRINPSEDYTIDNCHFIDGRINCSRVSVNRKSRYMGLTLDNKYKVWRVRIRKNGKLYYAGGFKDENEAARVYNELALKVLGNKAILNKVLD